jgi:hypothetical protein
MDGTMATLIEHPGRAIRHPRIFTTETERTSEIFSRSNPSVIDTSTGPPCDNAHGHQSGVMDLLDAYGVTDEARRHALITLAREPPTRMVGEGSSIKCFLISS